MVKLVRHTLVDRSVNLDVDIIADFEDPKVGGEMGRTFLPEGAGEGISGARPQSVTRRHFVAISLRNQMQFESTEILGFPVYAIPMGFLYLGLVVI